MYLTFWSLWQWNATDFNTFSVDVTMSPSIATCKNIRIHLGRGVDSKLAILFDDVQIVAKSTASPTPSPTFAPVSQVIQPTISPSTQHTIGPTTTALSCPLIGNGPLTLWINNVNIKFADVGTICTLVKATADANSGNITAIVPLARSYDGFVWELAAGDYAASFSSSNIFECYDHSCQFKLPNTMTNEWFQLRSYQNSLADVDQYARMLERTSFGITQSDLMAISSLSTVNGEILTTDALSYKMAQWVKIQMAANATSHREFWRLRANARVCMMSLSDFFLHNSMDSYLSSFFFPL